MDDKLFIAIGVSKATGLPTLPGVYASVRNLTTWATASHYTTVSVTDESEPVDVARVKAAIEAKLTPNLSRVILYFVGHGYSAPPEQYLILSAGRNTPDQRIARDGLRDMLASYGPAQISVITDACMVMAAFKGLAVSVLDPDDGECPPQTFDGFYATQPNTQAFAFRATPEEPELCLFSWVIHRGLTFADLSASDTEEAKHGRIVVTSYSLGDYLDRAVPREAAARDAWQQPQTNTGFRPPNHVYSEQPALPPSGDHAKTALDPDDGGPTRDDDAANWSVDLEPGTEDSETPSPSALMPEPRLSRRAPTALASRVRSEWRRPFTRWAFETAREARANLVLDVVSGKKNPQIWTPNVGFVHAARAPSFEGRDHHHAYIARVPAGLDPEGIDSGSVILRIDNHHTLAPMYRNLWCVIQLERGRGPIALAWGSVFQPPAGNMISALEILQGLLQNRLVASDIPELAATMRYEKHQDPLKGMVAAYLYDSVGDVGNIRRMCAYYGARGQQVPFDVALLARLPFQREGGRLQIQVPEIQAEPGSGPIFTREAMPARDVAVAGETPLLRAGWSKLERAGLFDSTLARLAEDLTDNPIATFEGPAAEAGLLEAVAAR